MKNSLAIVLTLSAPLAILAQTTVFNDTFNNGSTVQSASPITPTANSTTYQYFQQGAAPTTPTIASGDLHLQGRTTTSSISEVQALFTTAPVTLTTIGDYVDLQIVFTDTQNILVGGTTSSLNVGLFNSGGVKPNQGVRLDTGTLTGGAQNWNGYASRILGTGVASVFTRQPQIANGATSQNQDLIFEGASGSATFTNPAAMLVGGTTTTTFTGGLTQGSTYTVDYQIVLSAANTLTISNSLYSGSSVAGTPLYSQLVMGTGATYTTNSFDGLALGWRYNSTSAANSVDISSINVNDLVQSVPEPSTIALSGLGIFALGAMRRLKNKK